MQSVGISRLLLCLILAASMWRSTCSSYSSSPSASSNDGSSWAPIPLSRAAQFHRRVALSPAPSSASATSTCGSPLYMIAKADEGPVEVQRQQRLRDDLFLRDTSPIVMPPSWLLPHSTASRERGLGPALTLYLAPQGSDASNCSLAAAPCQTLVRAVGVANGIDAARSAAVTIALAAGVYDAGSCGARLYRDVSIVGTSGSRLTTIDCAGRDRVVATNASIELSGVTLTHGVACANGNLTSCTLAAGAHDGYGGGAVSVVWPDGVADAHASFVDVAWVGNAAIAGTANRTVGGGALSVYCAGSSTRTTVSIAGCSFTNNSVLCPECDAVHAVGVTSFGFSGAAALVQLGDSDVAVVVNASTSVADTTFDGNAVPSSDPSRFGGGGGGAVTLATAGSGAFGYRVVVRNVTATRNDNVGAWRGRRRWLPCSCMEVVILWCRCPCLFPVAWLCVTVCVSVSVSVSVHVSV